MKKPGVIAFSLSLFLLVPQTEPCAAAQQSGKSSFKSIDGRFEIRVSDTAEPYVYRLQILADTRELADYKFKGELVSAYWSPSGRYVALNNHYGHYGWYLWILSLDDGSVITAHGNVNAKNYDRYLDYECTPNIRTRGKDAIEKVYSGFSKDHLRAGYLSVAFGWKSATELLMFHEFPCDNLFQREHAVIWVNTIFVIRKSGITVRGVSVRKVNGKWTDKYPPEVSKTLKL